MGSRGEEPSRFLVFSWCGWNHPSNLEWFLEIESGANANGPNGIIVFLERFKIVFPGARKIRGGAVKQDPAVVRRGNMSMSKQLKKKNLCS